MAKYRGLKAAELERLFHKWLIYVGNDRRHIVRAIKTQWQRVDLFASDFMIMGPDRFEFYQTTTAKGKTARRRKLEKFPWPGNCWIYVVTHERTDDPVDRRKSRDYFRFEQYHPQAGWQDPSAVEFNIKAVQAIKIKEPKG